MKGEEAFLPGGPTEKWWRGFRRRHPDVTLRRAGSMDKARSKITTKDVIDHYFDLLKNVLDNNVLSDKPRQIYNCDESAMFLNKMSEKVVVPVRQKRAISLQVGTSEHISVNCCVAADGHTLPPMIIFSGSFPGGAYHANGPNNALYSISDSGFMDSHLFLEWFTKLFLVYAVPQRPLLLLMDGHSSHINAQLVDIAIDNDVILLCLPPHTTHLLQPLDVAVYRSLKSHFSKLVNDARLLKSDLWVSKKMFSAIFKLAFEECFTMKTICAGFRKCGIFPYDPEAIDASFISLTDDTPSTQLQSVCQQKSPNPETTVPEEIPAIEPLPSCSNGDGIPRPCPSSLALQAVERTLSNSQKILFNKRFTEGYNLKTDQLYLTWKTLKEKASATAVTHPIPKEASSSCSEPVNENVLVKYGVVSEELSNILVSPVATCKARGSRPANKARVLTCEEVANTLREKAEKKQKEDEAKKKKT